MGVLHGSELRPRGSYVVSVSVSYFHLSTVYSQDPSLLHCPLSGPLTPPLVVHDSGLNPVPRRQGLSEVVGFR